MLGDWENWCDYQVIVDEIPDPYQIYSRNFQRTADYVARHIEVDTTETNYYRLRLTTEGNSRLDEHDVFDDNENSLRNLMDGIKSPNSIMYAYRPSWDEITRQKVQLMRLTNARFLAPFERVTIMGDEFRQSMLALAWEHKYDVDWQPHPQWQPSWRRAVPLKDRARIFYFASKDERRGSVTAYAEGKFVPKILAWFDDPANDPGQVLITTNKRFEEHFETPKFISQEAILPDGSIQSTIISERKIKRLWKAPKLAGSDEYKTLSNVAFLAAMRPSGDERQFVERALLISEDEVIRWREYNTLYQFVMRINLRVYESWEIANVYVFDQWQAEYLRERFGGCLEMTHIKGVLGNGAGVKKGGRPAKNGARMSDAEQKRRRRAEIKATKLAEEQAKPPSNQKLLTEIIRKTKK